MGTSPTLVAVGEKEVADDNFLSFSLSLSFILRNLLVFCVLVMGIENCGAPEMEVLLRCCLQG